MSGSGSRETNEDRQKARVDAVAFQTPDGGAFFPIVGIGTSAGGLEPCKRLLTALPHDTGMAFILVQHLDPSRDSMMVDLLSGTTSLAVELASEGLRVEREHLYVIPPGTYLSIVDGALRLSQPHPRGAARLPFDALLHSMARDCGPRAVCVVLSGAGADGSLGLRAVKKRGGFVIAQDPEEAGYDGMPRGAIATGCVDLVLPVAGIPRALAGYARRIALAPRESPAPTKDAPSDRLSDIIALLGAKSALDYTAYKPGTLERRVERRMAMAGMGPGEQDRYVALLREDPGELDSLAKDLLIHVTSFFRNADVFEVLSRKIVPDLVAGFSGEGPLRIWIAGCSTGEETYSIAMIVHEQIVAARRNIRLQIFASDVDDEAIATARAGFYPKQIETDVSAERLARFFAPEDDGYRVSPSLRACVVFSVQDLLADPPFSRLDMVCCRNLLIYLGPQAQKKVIALFHFALRDGGILLLGNSETVGAPDDRFHAIEQAERIYRRVGAGRSGAALMSNGAGAPSLSRAASSLAPNPKTTLAELCRRLLVEDYAPAAVLTNRNCEGLYYSGATDDYLAVPAGDAVHDLFAMARDGVRAKLRLAIQRARRENVRVVVTGGRLTRNGVSLAFSVVARPVASNAYLPRPAMAQAVAAGEDDLLLVCFLEDAKPARDDGRSGPADDTPRMADLERELDATRTELEVAIRARDIAGEEQKAINEEALSVNEEYQSTNEELVSSKEELQSLNEELTALNSHLQETLERQRRTSNDLENVLNSTDVATLFLDPDLKIRFFTPAIKALFAIIASDVGRPLADFTSLAADIALADDAREVLRTLAPQEREIHTRNGLWFSRRILPYRTHAAGVEGIVITFTDITHRKQAGRALEIAKQQADRANAAKSRFLAMASHDLRQPLQTLKLIQGMLVKTVEGEKAQRLVARSEDVLGAMATMLNTLLDINQIEAGTISVAVSRFPVAPLLELLREEFSYYASAKGLSLRVVPSRVWIQSDHNLLEQMIRNLLSNALKYTKTGRVLLGCRRRSDRIVIEIWDTGAGIPDADLQVIFEEYHQLENTARDPGHGLGLGLSIVRRFGDLLGHSVRVRSRLGRGSVFGIEVPLALEGASARIGPEGEGVDHALAGHRVGMILIVEDDPELRELLAMALTEEGHHVVAAPDGLAALDLVAKGAARPDLVLADFNLPGAMDGLVVAAKINERLHRPIPLIILTGDISTEALRSIANQDCIRVTKPVKPRDLARLIQELLPEAPPRPLKSVEPSKTDGHLVFVIDDDGIVRETIRGVLEDDGLEVEDYASCEAFLDAYRPGREACVLVDAYLPGMSGLALLEHPRMVDSRLPAIMITGSSDVAIAVHAMKAGASDFIEKPIGRDELLASVARALEQSRDSGKLFAWRKNAADRVASLTARQGEIMHLVLAGHPSKNIAADLGISQRTVENHRASIMKKTGAKSLPALARLALAAASIEGDQTAG